MSVATTRDVIEMVRADSEILAQLATGNHGALDGLDLSEQERELLVAAASEFYDGVDDVGGFTVLPEDAQGGADWRETGERRNDFCEITDIVGIGVYQKKLNLYVGPKSI